MWLVVVVYVHFVLVSDVLRNYLFVQSTRFRRKFREVVASRFIRRWSFFGLAYFSSRKANNRIRHLLLKLDVVVFFMFKLRPEQMFNINYVFQTDRTTDEVEVKSIT